MQQEVHERIQTLTDAIFLIDREIDQHSLSIRKLQAKKARLTVELRNAKATITLARKLPEELYRKIFHICLLEGDHTTATPTSPLALSQVCASWRIAALASPLLWSTIHVTPFTRPELIKHHLAFSAACPLRLVIATANDELLLLALSQLERWKEVTIVTERALEADAILAALTRSAGNFISLRVHVWGENEPDFPGEMEHLKAAFPDSPKFKHLSYTSHLLPRPPIFPSHITDFELVESASLELSDMGLEIFGNRVLDILEELPQLISFALQSRCPSIRSDFILTLGLHAPPPVPVARAARHLKLSRLKKLILTGLPAICAEILIHLLTPALEELCIRNTSIDALRPTASERGYREALRVFLSQRQSEDDEVSSETVVNLPLRKLQIHNTSLPPGTLAHLPNLRVLQLHDSDVEDDTLDELCRHGTSNPPLEDLDLRWEGRVGGSAIVRLLRDLATSGSNGLCRIKRVTLLHCSNVRESDVLEVARITTCRLIAEEGDYCYTEGCCKNTRYRQRLRLLYFSSLNSDVELRKSLIL